MIDEAVQWLCGLLAVAVAAGYLCRLGMLSLRDHRASVAVMHACLFGGALFAVDRALHLQASLGDLLFVCGAGAWLMISMQTWAGGVPPHFSRTVRRR